MENEDIYKSDNDCIGMLRYIFKDVVQFYNQIAPQGLKNSDLVLCLHPTPQQQYEEHVRMAENVNRLLKDPKPQEKEIKIDEFYQDDLTHISEFEDFICILGLSVYDIFSNNHEVIDSDHKIYDFGSMRGSGRFIAHFLNEHFPDHSAKYGYMDFYMGTIWIDNRGNLVPIYEYIFKKLKNKNCDWRYSFPKMSVIVPREIFDESKEENLETYNPEKSIEEELEKKERKKQTKNLQEELDKIHNEAYDDAKYKPLIPVVQAYKNVYGLLPEGHPQKEFE